MPYKSNRSNYKKRYNTKIKMLILLILLIIYGVAYKYISKNDNKIVSDTITVNNGGK